ncbi:hypothetical protein LguiA_021221 [Lonicera macranthoides]
MNLFKFPELVAKSKRSPEKNFRLIDLYETIFDLFPEIESIFSYVSISEIKLQVLPSFYKLAESIQVILTDFESSIQKNSSKALTANGRVHPLTNSTMNYKQHLANYSGALGNIFAYSPSPEKSISPLPKSYFNSPILVELVVGNRRRSSNQQSAQWCCVLWRMDMKWWWRRGAVKWGSVGAVK